MIVFAEILEILTLISLSAFCGTLLFIALVIVKFWQSLAPNDFFSWMKQNFFRLPKIMVPLNLLSLVLAIASMAISWLIFSVIPLSLSLGLLALFACTITFPIYFAGANAESIDRAIANNEVSEKLALWSRWHWLRTGFVLIAIYFVAFDLLN